MRYGFVIALAIVAVPLQAQAPGIGFASEVFVERDAGAMRTVEASVAFRKGERVVTVMRWDAPPGGYTVTSAVPRTLQFEQASADTLEVSTDGGRTWRIFAGVQPEAVTHLRWRVGNGPGRLIYSAIVR